MISKSQTIDLSYARRRTEKKPVILSKKDRIQADRMVMIILFVLVIILALVVS